MGEHDCIRCGQPMLPAGEVKRPSEYDHASGCPLATPAADVPRPRGTTKTVKLDWEQAPPLDVEAVASRYAADVPRPEPRCDECLSCERSLAVPGATPSYCRTCALAVDAARVESHPEPAVASLEERLWLVEKRNIRLDGEWRIQYAERLAEAPDEPGNEWFEYRVTEYVPADLLSQVAAEARARALEEAAGECSGEATEWERHATGPAPVDSDIHRAAGASLCARRIRALRGGR
jgi:hypothetical protein